jgi:hypothetical protein
VAIGAVSHATVGVGLRRRLGAKKEWDRSAERCHCLPGSSHAVSRGRLVSLGTNEM